MALGTVSTSCPDACRIAAQDAGRLSSSLKFTGSGHGADLYKRLPWAPVSSSSRGRASGSGGSTRGRHAPAIAGRSVGTPGRASCKRQVSGSNPLTGSRRSSRFGRVHVHVWAWRCRAAATGRDQGRCAPRFRGNVRRNCVRSLRRVGWPRSTCGRDRNRAASAQVKAKREDLSLHGTLPCGHAGMVSALAGDRRRTGLLEGTGNGVAQGPGHGGREGIPDLAVGGCFPA
jgi:hypothetical protein